MEGCREQGQALKGFGLTIERAIDNHFAETADEEMVDG